MSLTSLLNDFVRAGLTPDEKGEFKIGMSEAGRLQSYYDNKKMMEELEKPISFNRFDPMDDFK